MSASDSSSPLPTSNDPTLATFTVGRTAWADLLPALAAHLCACHKLVVLVPPTDTTGLAEQWLAALAKRPRPPGTQIGGRALEDRLWEGEAPVPLGAGDATTVAWVEHDLHGYEVACTPALTAIVVADGAWYKESELLGYRDLLAGQGGRKHFYVVNPPAG